MEVNNHFYNLVEETSSKLYVKALKDLPPDVRIGLKAAYERETSTTGLQILNTMLENVKIADSQTRLICQDTGIPIYFVKVGDKMRLSMCQLEEAIVKGTARATTEHPFRSSVVSPLKRQNNQNSTGYRIPVIHYQFVKDSEDLEILMVPKGSGSENMSFLKMLIPADGLRGVKRHILETIIGMGANPCPPYTVGIGLGGTSDLCMKLAKIASTTRELDSKNSDPEMAELEQELLEAINSLKIGPMGLGGVNTAMAVHIEHAYTHITQNPVGINIQCWPARRARAIFKANGNIEYGY